MDWFRALLPILIGYLLGSIPFGYVIVRLIRRIDIRDYGSHNIGATNVLRVVGWFPALLTLVGDIGKGAAPPVLATLPWFSGGNSHPWIVVFSALAAVIGHAYSGFFYLKERKFARGKAVATAAGSALGFVAAGQVRWEALAAVLIVWGAALVLPKLVQRRWGWVSLASILAAIALPIALGVFGAKLPFILFGVAAAVFVTWKHKENIGRLMDGVEPRLGEKPPLAGIDKDEVAAAFLIHAMSPDDWWQTRRFSWARPLHRAGLLPSGVLKRLFRLVKPMKVDVVHGITAPDGRTVICYLLCVPLLPEDIKASPKLAVKRAIQGAQMARSLGARCMGLGAYCSVIGNKGLDVQKAVPEMPITNGGAYTAGTVRDAVPMLLTKLRARGVEPDEAVAAVVGANGVVGFGVCRQLAWKVRKLIMIGTDLSRLEKSAAILRRRMEKHPGAEIVITTDRSASREADMLFTATSTVEPVITKAMVKPGAVIYDLGRPADVDLDVLEVPDVTLIPGGVIRPPGRLTCRLDTHFGPGLIPACMAETLLIALDECYDRVSLGEGTKAENIEYFVEAADRLGFVLVDEVARPETEPAKVAVPVPA